jgi:hypothetical protein
MDGSGRCTGQSQTAPNIAARPGEVKTSSVILASLGGPACPTPPQGLAPSGCCGYGRLSCLPPLGDLLLTAGRYLMAGEVAPQNGLPQVRKAIPCSREESSVFTQGSDWAMLGLHTPCRTQAESLFLPAPPSFPYGCPRAVVPPGTQPCLCYWEA